MIRRILDRETIWKEMGYAVAGYFVLLAATVAIWPTDLILKPINSWNVFHYALGSKYFDKLGYYDFYNGIVLADAEGKKIFVKAGRVRDLRTYEYIRVDEALRQANQAGIRQRFGKKRWEEFKGDIQAIQRLRPTRRWARPIKDRGFNPSPVWLIVHRPLLNLVNLQSKRVIAFLCYAQMILYMVTFAVAWWAFGSRATLIGGLWFAFYFGNWGLKLGGYFSHDWFCYTVCAVGLYKKEYHRGAAVLLAYAAMMRGFPGLLALYPVMLIGSRLVRFKRPERKHLEFVGLLVATSAVLFGMGCLTKRGTGAWSEWRDKIEIHAEHHRYSAHRVGLQQVFAHDYETGKWDVHFDRLKEVVERQQPAYRVIAAVFIFFVLLAMLRRNENDGILLGLAAAFYGMMLSRYYFSTAVLLFTWSSLDRRRIGNLMGSVWLWFLVALYTFQLLVFKDPGRKLYTVFNYGIALYFAAVTGNFLARDAAWLWRRLRGTDSG